MRGLPPPPADVALIEAAWAIGDQQAVTTGWHVFSPGADAATGPQLETILGDFFLTCVQDLLNVLGTDVVCSALRISTYGTQPQVVQYAPAPNVGAVGTTNPVSGALCLTWRTSNRGPYSLGHTFLPLSDELVDSDHAHLKSISWSQAQSAARAFTTDLNAIASPDGAQCVFVVLSRSFAGVPRPISLMFPVVLGDASPFIGTLRRRVRARRATSSPF